MNRVLVVSLGFVSLLTAARSPAQQASAADPHRGQQIFVAKGCYECHGYVGQGGAAGARIGPMYLPDAGFIAYIRRPSGQMPAYSARVISDAELLDIWAYLKTIPDARPAKDIPLLSGSHTH